MRAGKLRHRVEVQERTPSRSDTGEVLTAWSKLSNRWASVEPLKGRELLLAQQLQSECTFRVRMRYDSAITDQHRIVHRSRVLEILEVINPEERNAELELLCKETK